MKLLRTLLLVACYQFLFETTTKADEFSDELTHLTELSIAYQQHYEAMNNSMIENSIIEFKDQLNQQTAEKVLSNNVSILFWKIIEQQIQTLKLHYCQYTKNHTLDFNDKGIQIILDALLEETAAVIFQVKSTILYQLNTYIKSNKTTKKFNISLVTAMRIHFNIFSEKLKSNNENEEILFDLFNEEKFLTSYNKPEQAEEVIAILNDYQFISYFTEEYATLGQANACSAPLDALLFEYQSVSQFSNKLKQFSAQYKNRDPYNLENDPTKPSTAQNIYDNLIIYYQLTYSDLIYTKIMKEKISFKDLKNLIENIPSNNISYESLQKFIPEELKKKIETGLQTTKKKISNQKNRNRRKKAHKKRESEEKLKRENEDIHQQEKLDSEIKNLQEIQEEEKEGKEDIHQQEKLDSEIKNLEETQEEENQFDDHEDIKKQHQHYQLIKQKNKENSQLKEKQFNSQQSLALKKINLSKKSESIYTTILGGLTEQSLGPSDYNITNDDLTAFVKEIGGETFREKHYIHIIIPNHNPNRPGSTVSVKIHAQHNGKNSFKIGTLRGILRGAFYHLAELWRVIAIDE